MIAALRFGAPLREANGRAVRRATFASRSTLPLSAACVVANGVRERLSRLLAAEIEVELLDPIVPDAAERRLLVAGATIARVRGRLSDGFVVVRSADARRLVAFAFGETERSDREVLSTIERTTLERIAADLVPLCNALCGTLGTVVRESDESAARDIATYFEVRTIGSPRVAIGFGMTRDPREEVAGTLTADDLGAVEIEGRVEFATGALTLAAFSQMAPGATIAFDTAIGAPGTLWFGKSPFARVVCGVARGRNAATLDSDPGDAA